MQYHTHRPSPARVLHSPGEVILAAVGNFLEDPDSARKPRPVVILRTGDCQHMIAGLTTNEHYATTGGRRTAIPNPGACGLDREGYLWSRRPCLLSRIDAIHHIGWADQSLVRVIAETMHVPADVFGDLWRAAARHHSYRCHGLAI